MVLFNFVYRPLRVFRLDRTPRSPHENESAEAVDSLSYERAKVAKEIGQHRSQEEEISPFGFYCPFFYLGPQSKLVQVVERLDIRALRLAELTLDVDVLKVTILRLLDGSDCVCSSCQSENLF